MIERKLPEGRIAGDCKTCCEDCPHHWAKPGHQCNQLRERDRENENKGFSDAIQCLENWIDAQAHWDDIQQSPVVDGIGVLKRHLATLENGEVG